MEDLGGGGVLRAVGFSEGGGALVLGVLQGIGGVHVVGVLQAGGGGTCRLFGLGEGRAVHVWLVLLAGG